MAVVAGAIVIALLLLVALVLFGIYIRYASRFVPTSRQLKALENAATSAVDKSTDEHIQRALHRVRTD